MPEFALVFIRGTVAYFTLLLYTRLMGKKQMSQLTFFDYIVGITVGSMAATMTVELENTLLNTLAGLTIWTGYTLLLGFIDLKSVRLRRVVDADPTVVIQNGRVVQHNLARMRYSVDELLMQLRIKDVFDLEQVEFAVLEPNGKLSVLKKSQFQPVTPQDLGLHTRYQGLYSKLIMDGEVIEDNLEKNQLTRQWLLDQLRKQGIDDPKEVFLALLDTQGELYVDRMSQEPAGGADRGAT